jgi:hypothetical protein
MSPKRSEEKEEPVTVVEVISEQERFRAIDLAREGGHVGTWQYRAAMLRFKFDGETQMGRQEFTEKLNAVANFEIR